MEFQLFDFNLCDNFLDEIGGGNYGLERRERGFVLSKA